MTRPIRRTLAAAAVAGLVLLGGSAACGTEQQQAPAGQPVTASQAVPNPTSISVERLGIESSLVPTAVDAEGGFVIPDDAGQASWFVPGPEPGQNGRSIILGHVNLDGEQGVFSRLPEARQGDVIEIGQDGGEPRRWQVTQVIEQDKADWQAAGMYDELDHPEIALVTCSGDLRTLPDGTRSYESNTVVMARLAETVGEQG